MPAADKLITQKEVSEMLNGRCRSAIFEDIKRGELPAPIKLGRSVFYSQNAVMAAIDKLHSEAQRQAA